MKNKFFIALFIITISSMGVGLYISKAIDQVVLKLNNIVKVHKVQVLQEKLVYQLQEVQSRLIAKDTQFAKSENNLANEVAEMSRTMNSCFNCHHTEEIAVQLEKIQTNMEEFKGALSRAFTIRADSTLYGNTLKDAFLQSQELTQHLNELLSIASKKLGKRANTAMIDISNTQRNVNLLVLCTPFLVLAIGFYLLKSFTSPLSSLLKATRKLTGGDLEYRVTGLQHEFGELAESFNSMAESIMQQMKDMQRAEQMAALGQLAAGLAHEIKNPLTGIKVSMEVLANELDIEEDDRRILHMVILEINHINTLINELLNYARPSKPNFESIPINTVLDKIVEAASYSVQKQKANGTTASQNGNIIITKEFAPGNLLVNADPAQLHQIFLNILLNGIESMPKGGELTVKTFLTEGADSLCINIADTGPGVDVTAQEKLFEPFFTTKKKGTGLGLAISKRLVEQHNGEIVAKNKEEGGASFSVYLPIDSRAEGILKNEKKR